MMCCESQSPSDVQSQASSQWNTQQTCCTIMIYDVSKIFYWFPLLCSSYSRGFSNLKDTKSLCYFSGHHRVSLNIPLYKYKHNIKGTRPWDYSLQEMLWNLCKWCLTLLKISLTRQALLLYQWFYQRPSSPYVKQMTSRSFLCSLWRYCPAYTLNQLKLFGGVNDGCELS